MRASESPSRFVPAQSAFRPELINRRFSQVRYMVTIPGDAVHSRLLGLIGVLTLGVSACTIGGSSTPSAQDHMLDICTESTHRRPEPLPWPARRHYGARISWSAGRRANAAYSPTS